jgi:hypothetical protein
MKKYLFFFFILVILSSCYSVSLIHDDTSSSFFWKKYGPASYFSSGSLPLNIFNGLSFMGTDSIMQDSRLTMDQKRVKKELFKQQFQWENKCFFYAVFTTLQGLTPEESDFKLDLIDSKNKSIVVYRQNLWIRQYGRGPTSNDYYFIIKTEKPITKENYDESRFPMFFNITLPGGEKLQYRITL